MSARKITRRVSVKDLIKQMEDVSRPPASPIRRQASPIRSSPSSPVRRQASPVRSSPSSPVRRQASPVRRQASPIRRQATRFPKVCPPCPPCSNIWNNSPDKIMKKFCKKFPSHGACDRVTSSVVIPPPPIGLIVDTKGRGVGIVTSKGETQKFPLPIPKKETAIAENGGIPVYENLSEDDIKKSTPIISAKNAGSFLESIRKGTTLRSVRCESGLVWNNATKSCERISKKGDTSFNTAMLARRQALKEEIEDESDDEWDE
jgi:hypothetical protein